MNGKQIGCAALLVLLLVVVGITALVERTTATQVSGVITDTYIKRDGKSDVYYVNMRLTNGTDQIFSNQDSWWWGKVNSSDIQHDLKRAKDCHIKITVTVNKWRIPFFSWYQNLVQVNSPIKDC